MSDTNQPTVVWGEPPEGEGRGRHGVWSARLAPFVENPGRWGMIMEVPAKDRRPLDQAANNIRTGPIRFPAGTTAKDYEVRVRTFGRDGERITGLWVRYDPPTPLDTVEEV